MPLPGILDPILNVLDITDNILGPAILNLTPSSMTIEVRQYAAGYRSAAGSYTVISSIALPTYVQTRLVTTKEIADTGGRFEQGDVIVGPIRPQFTRPDGTVGGFTQAQLDPAPGLTQNATTNQGTDVVYILAAQYPQKGGISGEFTLKEFMHDRWDEYKMRLRNRLTTPETSP